MKNEFKMIDKSILSILFTERPQRTYILLLLVIIGVNLAYYIYFIFQFPHFIFDDYYIFYRIKNNPNLIISTDPQDKFFLFFRPITYLYFFFLYQLGNNNAVIMKSVTLLLEISTVVITIVTIIEYSKLCKIKSHLLLLFFSGIFLSFNLDTFISVLWISNANELLSGLLYASIFLLISLFLRNKMSSAMLFIILSNVLFVLSICTKQNSAHLPLLFILLFSFFKMSIEPEKRKALQISLLVMFITLIVFILLNIIYYESHVISGLENLYKKPFAIIGTILISFFPFPGKGIYNYFILHKLAAGIILLLLCVFFGIIVLRGKRYDIKKIMTVIFAMLLIYFPRLFAQSGERLNIIQIIFISSLVFMLFNNKNKILYGMYGLAIVSNMIESQNVLHKIQTGYVYNRNADIKLLEMKTQEYNQNHYILWRNVWTTTPYSFYFTATNNFGNDTTVIMSEISAFDINSWLDFGRDVKTEHISDMYRLTSTNSNTYFNISNYSSANIIDAKGSDIRGFSEVTFQPIRSSTANINFVYFNDSSWMKVK